MTGTSGDEEGTGKVSGDEMETYIMAGESEAGVDSEQDKAGTPRG